MMQTFLALYELPKSSSVQLNPPSPPSVQQSNSESLGHWVTMQLVLKATKETQKLSVPWLPN